MVSHQVNHAGSSDQELVEIDRRKNGLLVFAICVGLSLTTWLVFGQTLGHEFINYDDYAYVVDNPEVAKGLTLSGIRWAFTHIHAYNWHPLTTLSHMLDSQLYGLKPAGHHATNVILHTLSILLLFLVLRNMTGAVWRSAFVAALFAIHPLHVESVAWIAERKDVLSALFFILSLGAYQRYVRARSLLSYLLLLFVFVLGLLSKPMLVTLPFVLMILDYWPLRRFPPIASAANAGGVSWLNRLGGWSGLILEKLPLFLLSAVSCAITIAAQGRSVRSIGSLPIWVRVYQAVISIVTYIGQMLWPIRLAAFYPYPAGALSVLPAAGALVLLVLITIVVFRLGRQYRYLVTGWSWYVIMLAPVIGLVQVGIQAHADRYTYLPQIGLYVLVTWAACDLVRSWRHRRALLTIAGGITVGMLAWCAWIQTRYWRNSESLWRHTLAVTGNNPVAHNDLGNALDRKGLTGEAMIHFRKAVALWPAYADGYYNLGTALLREHRVDEAIACWEKDISIRPDDPDAHSSLGRGLFIKRRIREAISHYEKSLQIAPLSPGVLNELAWILSTCGDAEVRSGARAIVLARQADQLGGGKNPVFARTLAAAYAESHMFSDAMETAQRALRLALEKNDSALADQIRLDLDLYRLNLPRR